MTTTTRRLAAIMAADIAGFSAAMERDEEGTFAQVQELRRKVIEPKIAKHTGRLVKTTGDGFLAEFASPIAAMRCALAIQAELTSNPLKLRIGLNLGDVIVEENGDVYGDGVNVAARLEGLAEPGGVLVSDKILREVEGKVKAAFEDKGEQQVKNLARPVRVYAVQRVTDKPAGTLATGDGKVLPLPDKPSIAVLPFDNLSGDVEQTYFCDGIVEDIITALSRFKSLFVIARNSSFTYKGKAVDVKQVGRELGVRYVLEGSVRKSGGRVRITGQLIEAASGMHMWADRFDGALDDIFQLQDAVVEQVVGQIGPSIERAEVARAMRKPVERLEAYDLYLKGKERFSLGGQENVELALKHFYRAVELDPTMAIGYASIAHCYNTQRTNGWMSDPERVMRETQRCVELAANLGQDDAECLAMCAMGYGFVLRQHGIADTLIDRALALNPNSSAAWRIRALAHVWFGRHDQVIEAADRAIRLNPRDRWTTSRAIGAKGFALFHKGNYSKACELAAQAHQLAPEWNLMLLLLAVTKAKADPGQMDEARSLMQQYLTYHPHLRVSNCNDHLPATPEDLDRLIEAARLAGLPE